jgi:hypothetical protein
MRFGPADSSRANGLGWKRREGCSCTRVSARLVTVSLQRCHGEQAEQSSTTTETETIGSDGIVKTRVMKEKLFEIFNYCWRSDSS